MGGIGRGSEVLSRASGPALQMATPAHRPQQQGQQAGADQPQQQRQQARAEQLVIAESERFTLNPAPALNASAALARDFEGREMAISTVRNVGKKTFYQREGRWIDADVKPEEDKKATVIEQFSEDFFKLAREQGAELNQYLTFAEPVTVKLAGKVYRFEPAKQAVR